MVKSSPIMSPERQANSARSVKTRRFFPLLAVKLFCISIILVLGAAVFVDRIVLPELEDRGLLGSHGWDQDNKIRWKLLAERNSASYDSPVWRSALSPVSKEKGSEKRILVVGDSFAWGDGYANLNDIWWRQLERELHRRGYTQVSVMSAGMCGAQTAEQARWLREVAASYHPDLVIMGFVNNDTQEYEDAAARTGIVKRLGVFQTPIKSVEEQLGKLFPYLSLHLGELRQGRYSESRSSKERGFETAQWNYELLEGENFKRYEKTVEELSKVISKAGCPVFVMTLPSGYHMATPAVKGETELAHTLRDIKNFHRHIYDRVGPVFENVGIRFVDNLDPYVAGAATDKYIAGSPSPRFAFGINPRNSHPGPYSTLFYAKYASDVLEKEYPNYLGSKDIDGKQSPVVAVNDTAPGDIQFERGDKPGRFRLTYPPSDQSLLFMPERIPAVQINLKSVSRIKEISLTGPGLSNARIWVSSIDPEVGYDSGAFFELERKSAGGFVYEVPIDRSERVNSVRVNADFKGGDRTLVLELGGS